MPAAGVHVAALYVYWIHSPTSWFYRRSVQELQEGSDRFEKMLTDTIMEEEFELKEEEPWYDRQDLEHGTGPGHSLSPKPLRLTSMI